MQGLSVTQSRMLMNEFDEWNLEEEEGVRKSGYKDM